MYGNVAISEPIFRSTEAIYGNLGIIKVVYGNVGITKSIHGYLGSNESIYRNIEVMYGIVRVIVSIHVI